MSEKSFDFFPNNFGVQTFSKILLWILFLRFAWIRKTVVYKTCQNKIIFFNFSNFAMAFSKSTRVVHFGFGFGCMDLDLDWIQVYHSELFTSVQRSECWSCIVAAPASKETGPRGAARWNGSLSHSSGSL